MRKPYRYQVHESADPAMTERLERIADRLGQVLCGMSGHDWDSHGKCRACELSRPLPPRERRSE